MSYLSPINSRYPADITSSLWSQTNKIKIMRQLWIDLAIFQKTLGISEIHDSGIEEMKQHLEEIDFELIQTYEQQFKHDIVAHIHAFGDICPNARSFLHLGVTSNFINDNVDLIIIKQCLHYLQMLNGRLFDTLKELSFKYIETPTIAYTHLQAGQLTTVGKRFTVWNSDLKLDIEELHQIYENLPFRGVKGTVGSEDSILKIFDGDVKKCKELNDMFIKKYEFKPLHISTQTYSRKYDVQVIHILSSICQTIYKMINDIRLLSSKYELYESFSKYQVGSSAMPYKKNPINCEKICSLCRYVITQEESIKQTYMNQWLERSLDDSAIKRIIYPEVFMLVEYILLTTTKILTDICVDNDKIKMLVDQHMPFILSEEIIVKGVKMGYNRQDIHEKLRILLTSRSFLMKEGDLSEKLKIFNEDETIAYILEHNEISVNPIDYIGNCKTQIETFYS